MTSRIAINTKDQGVWFTSDTHFGHRNILKYCAETRPCETVEQHDARLIHEWNSRVKEKDIVFHLGDVSFADAKYTHGVLEQLNGRKVLVMGNHDQVIRNQQPIQDLFEACVDYLRVGIDKQQVIMFHFPVFSWDMRGHGSYHFHGHTHGKRLSGMSGRYFDVGVDTHGSMAPHRWQDLRDIMEAIPLPTWED